MKRDEETIILTMARSIEEKVKKYWSEDVDNVKVNRLFYIGAILDPRKKMEIIPYSFKLIYEPIQCAELVEMSQTTDVSGDGGEEDDFKEDQEIEDDCFAEFDDDNHSSDDLRPELAKYLAEAREVSTDKKQWFDVLAYWKAYSL
ncbi:hypothetical protein LINPERPRIM_LOCUS25326, partial [Linum perenne]